ALRLHRTAPSRASDAAPYALALFALLAACVEVPTADRDIAEALNAAEPGSRLELLRKQDERIAGVPFSAGNAIPLLTDHPLTYQAMERLIAQAGRRVDMESHIFDEA